MRGSETGTTVSAGAAACARASVAAAAQNVRMTSVFMACGPNASIGTSGQEDLVKRVDPRRVERVMASFARAITGMELPAIEKISESQAEDPFQILIATLLSARTQDAT